MNNTLGEITGLIVKPEPQAIAITPGISLNAAVIVAHPDDETLWCGGMILAHPAFNWFIVSLCRKNDPDRAAKFSNALNAYGAKGAMGDVDDGPEQRPLDLHALEQNVLEMLPAADYDLILTHAPVGEYTRHRRHEEVSQAVIQLWNRGAISCKELWLFAYDDREGRDYPRAVGSAHRYDSLPGEIWREKYRIITAIYGFAHESWEARTTPVTEAFWCFSSPAALLEQLRGEAQQT